MWHIIAIILQVCGVFPSINKCESFLYVIPIYYDF